MPMMTYFRMPLLSHGTGPLAPDHRRGSAGAAGDRVERLAVVRPVAGQERVRQRHRCFGAVVVDAAAPADGSVAHDVGSRRVEGSLVVNAASAASGRIPRDSAAGKRHGWIFLCRIRALNDAAGMAVEKYGPGKEDAA